MKLIDHTYADPAANLACDEAFLQRAETNGGEEVLRFWESPTYFVVLGYSRPASSDADLESCRRENIPVLRRCSGGGTVLQGPGCLNYALVLRCEPGGPLATIAETNRYVLERNLCGMGDLRSAGAGIRGQSDLAVGGRKFSGNAQRRSARWAPVSRNNPDRFRHRTDRVGSGGGGGGNSSLSVGDFCCPEYLSTTLDLIQRNWNSRQQVAGATAVRFTVGRGGAVTDVEVARSSGYAVLDLAAHRAIATTRLPPLPRAYTNPQLTVTLTFQYQH